MMSADRHYRSGEMTSPVFTGFNVNVASLYHGTTCPLDQICNEGLDPRVSVHGHFGRGIYFRFATNDQSVLRTALVCLCRHILCAFCLHTHFFRF